MAKKIRTAQEQNSFEALYGQLTNIVAEIEADETPLELLPKLIDEATLILNKLNKKLRVIEEGLQIKTDS